tara:strand:+ start:2779 stop:4029 length:1251 start_codon:yes stop_codon:yes gene_type:complete
MAATFDSYFINAAVFSDATSIFTDSDMTIIAPDGIYQFDGVHRTMSGGILGSPFFCGTCCANCSGTYIYPIPPLKNKFHEVCSNIGQSTSSAIIAKFKFTSVPIQLLGYPIGIRASFDGQFYQGVTSNRFGYLPEFFVGDSTVVSPAELGTYSPYALDGLAWRPLTNTFIPTQNVPTWVTQSMVNSTANNPDECYLLVPKTTQSSTIDVQVFSPHRPSDEGGGGCDITIPCPSPLAPQRVSDVAASAAAACLYTSIDNKAYIMRVNSVSGMPRLYDRMFMSPSGLTPLPDGYYMIQNNFTGAVATTAWVHISGTNGVVQAVGTCASGPYVSLTQVIGSQMRNLAGLACAYQNQAGINLPDIAYWHNGTGDAPQAGNSLFLDVLGQTLAPDGFYQLLREYMVIQVSGGVLIGSINYC